jgi:hypothetical protein
MVEFEFFHFEKFIILIIFTGAAHCADMYPDVPDDPEPVRKARAIVRENIDKWLTE